MQMVRVLWLVMLVLSLLLPMVVGVSWQLYNDSNCSTPLPTYSFNLATSGVSNASCIPVTPVLSVSYACAPIASLNNSILLSASVLSNANCTVFSGSSNVVYKVAIVSPVNASSSCRPASLSIGGTFPTIVSGSFRCSAEPSNWAMTDRPSVIHVALLGVLVVTSVAYALQ